MKLLNAPRQPFIGLAAAAAAGIIFAEFFRFSPYVLLATAVLIAFCAVIVLRWPGLAATYAIVGAGFFLVHGCEPAIPKASSLLLSLVTGRELSRRPGS